MYCFINTLKLQWLEHRWLVYHNSFELVLDLLTNPMTAVLGKFYTGNGILCGGFNSQDTFMLKKIENISLSAS